MSADPELAALRKANRRLEAEIQKLRDEVVRLVQMPKADTWPEKIIEAQRTGFAFGVAHGMQETLKGVRSGVAGLNLGAMITGGLETLNTVEPKKSAPKKGARKQ